MVWLNLHFQLHSSIHTPMRLLLSSNVSALCQLNLFHNLQEMAHAARLGSGTAGTAATGGQGPAQHAQMPERTAANGLGGPFTSPSTLMHGFSLCGFAASSVGIL